MSKLITCYGLVSSLRMQTLLSRPLSLLAATDSIGSQPSLKDQNPNRTLYTAAALGVGRIDRLRDLKKQLFLGSTRDRYIERLMDYLKANDAESIYKDDIANLIGIAEDEKDLDLIEDVVLKCVGTKTNNHGWGALLFRLYYKMNQLERAYNNMKDFDRFGNFFNFRSCYKIMMVMLYDAGRYDDVLEVFQISQERLRDFENNDPDEVDAGADDTNPKVCRETSLLAFAALAKINTPEALERAEALFNKLNTNNRGLGLRPASFVSYLACSNDKPKLALNLISDTPNRNYITLRELKIVSLIKLGRSEDVLLQLREYVANVKRESNLLLRSTYELIQKNQANVEDPNVRQEINDLLVDINDQGHVSDVSMEEVLFKPIERERNFIPFQRRTPNGYLNNYNYEDNRNQRYDNRRYDNQRYDNQRYDNQRYENQRYQPRQPRSQFGDRQYDNYQQRQPRRGYRDQDDDESFGADNDSRQSRRRFSYQNMNFD